MAGSTPEQGGDQATIEANKEVVRRVFLEIFNEGKLALAEDLCSPDTLLHSPTLTEPGVGPEGIRQFVQTLRTGFPDLHIEIEDLIGERDKVVARWRSTRQTHLGFYQEIPPTGKSVQMTGIDIFRVVDGTVREIWLEIDAITGVRQMGVLPPPGLSKFARVRFMLGSLFRLAFLDAKSRRLRPKS